MLFRVVGLQGIIIYTQKGASSPSPNSIISCAASYIEHSCATLKMSEYWHVGHMAAVMRAASMAWLPTCSSTCRAHREPPPRTPSRLDPSCTVILQSECFHGSAMLPGPADWCRTPPHVVLTNAWGIPGGRCVSPALLLGCKLSCQCRQASPSSTLPHKHRPRQAKSHH